MKSGVQRRFPAGRADRHFSVWMRWKAECNDHNCRAKSGEVKSLNAMKSGVQRLGLEEGLFSQKGFECDEKRSATTSVAFCLTVVISLNAMKSGVQLLILQLIPCFLLEFECDEKRSATFVQNSGLRRPLQVWMRWKAECNKEAVSASPCLSRSLNAMKSGVQPHAWPLYLAFLLFECDEKRSATRCMERNNCGMGRCLNAMKSGVQLGEGYVYDNSLKVWMRWKAECNNVRWYFVYCLP